MLVGQAFFSMQLAKARRQALVDCELDGIATAITTTIIFLPKLF